MGKSYYYFDFGSGNRYLIGTVDPTTGSLVFREQPDIGIEDSDGWLEFLRKKEIDRFFLIDEPFCIQDETGAWCSFLKLFPRR